jgi:hypothetical protein
VLEQSKLDLTTVDSKDAALLRVSVQPCWHLRSQARQLWLAPNATSAAAHLLLHSLPVTHQVPCHVAACLQVGLGLQTPLCPLPSATSPSRSTTTTRRD